MRVTSSSFHCPSYCFSKPPPRHPIPPQRQPQPQPPPPLSPPPPLPPQWQACALQTKDSHHKSCRSFSGSPTKQEKLCDENLEIGENGVDGGKEAFLLKSSLRRTCPASKENVKDCVKWTDELGKELVEIREFEPVESGEVDDEMYGYPTCSCVIL